MGKRSKEPTSHSIAEKAPKSSTEERLINENSKSAAAAAAAAAAADSIMGEAQTQTQAQTQGQGQTQTQGQGQAQDLPKKKRKRRAPLVRWKKPKDMPKRPLSAYNIFFKEQREKMMNAAGAISATTEGTSQWSRRRSNKSIGIGFANLARTIAADWNDLDPEAKAPYEGRAAPEKERYKKEMLVWRAKQKEEKERAAATGTSCTRSQGGEADPSSLDGSRYTGMKAEATAIADSASEDEAQPLSEAARSISDPMPLDSLKQTRRICQPTGDDHARGADSSRFSPIRVPDLHNNSWSDIEHLEHLEHAQAMSQQQNSHHPGHSSMSRIHEYESAQARLAHLSQHGVMSTGYERAFGYGSYVDPWSGCVHSVEDHPLQNHNHYHQQCRRNTWSGVSYTSNTNTPAGAAQQHVAAGEIFQAVRRASNEREPTRGVLSFPDSWFEAEASPNIAPRAAVSIDHEQHQHQQAPRGSELYPDTWFEVQEPAADHTKDILEESIRYSPQGDLTGKLPAKKSSEKRATTSSSSLKSDRGEGKMSDDRPTGTMRSLEEMGSGASASAALLRGGEHTPVVESSLQTLGMQLDDETVDFLTKLQYDANAPE
jgi:hypothetical protein